MPDLQHSRWSDERLDDLAVELRFVSKTVPEVGKHGLRLDQHDDALRALHTTLARVDEKLDANDAAKKWTPAVIASALVPVLGTAATIAAVLLSNSPG